MNVFSIVIVVFDLFFTWGYCILIIQNILAKETHNGPNHSLTIKAEPNVWSLSCLFLVFRCCTRKNQQLPKIVKDVFCVPCLHCPFWNGQD